ncbi:MAG: glutamate--tRNA ligase [Legionellales bacterium]|nr:MAG: glutamate--tRNA ligase [Legionellales bacterium]
MTIITRFAPSPTGVLHLGSVRTALYAWAYARHSGGKFVLRIEDTDKLRSTQASVDIILQAMQWLELEYDVGPLYQSARTERYLQVVEELLASGKAYKCYCSKARLENLRESQQKNGLKPKYDKACLYNKIPQDDSASYVVRFNNPETGAVSFTDLVHGTISVNNSELDDLILLRSDASPTYNLTVVVDDLDLEISQVLRGDDHINNTFRQINIMLALGATPPQYAHMPMILGKDGKKLSKRQAAVNILDYKTKGFLKEALLNYLLRLGWSHGDQEIFSVAEMIQLFEIKNIHKSPATFDIDKLTWLNQHYIKTLDAEYLVQILQEHLQDLGVNTAKGPSLFDILVVQRDRAKTMLEMAEQSVYWFSDTIEVDAQAAAKHLHSEIMVPLQEFTKQLGDLEDWSRENIQTILKAIIAKFGLKFPKLAQPIRVAVTGNTNSPSIDATLWLLGKSRTLARLKASLA